MDYNYDRKGVFIKKIFLIIAIILVSFIILGASFYYFKNRSLKNNPDSNFSPIPLGESSPLPTKSATSEPEAAMKIKIFMIAENDNGKSGKLIGCGDSAVGVEREIPKTAGVLKAALEELLKVEGQKYGESGLYNALYQSDLKLESASIENETAIIKISGEIITSGTCDDPRFKAQIEETALQFPTVKKVEIFVNDKNLDEIFSQQG